MYLYWLLIINMLHLEVRVWPVQIGLPRNWLSSNRLNQASLQFRRLVRTELVDSRKIEHETAERMVLLHEGLQNFAGLQM